MRWAWATGSCSSMIRGFYVNAIGSRIRCPDSPIPIRRVLRFLAFWENLWVVQIKYRNCRRISLLFRTFFLLSFAFLLSTAFCRVLASLVIYQNRPQEVFKMYVIYSIYLQECDPRSNLRTRRHTFFDYKVLVSSIMICDDRDLKPVLPIR